MPQWVAALLICLGFFTLLLITNGIIIFQAAMAGGGSRRRWYQLFFATHEVLGGILGRSRTSRFILMLALVAIGTLLSVVSRPYGDAVFVVIAAAYFIFVSGFAVTRRPR